MAFAQEAICNNHLLQVLSHVLETPCDQHILPALPLPLPKSVLARPSYGVLLLLGNPLLLYLHTDPLPQDSHRGPQDLPDPPLNGLSDAAIQIWIQVSSVAMVFT